MSILIVRRGLQGNRGQTGLAAAETITVASNIASVNAVAAVADLLEDSGPNAIAAEAAKDAAELARDAAQAAQIIAEAAANGMKYRSVRAATTANITLSGPQTIDGVAVVAGQRILVKNQSTASQNGLYQVNAGAWTRTADANTWDELVGVIVTIEEGSTLTDTVWLCTANAGGTLNTTAVTFVFWTAFIPDASITLAKLAAIGANKLIGNPTGSSAVPTEVSVSTLAFTILARATAALMRTDLGAAASGANTDITTIVAGRPRNTQTASYTLVLGDAGKLVSMNVAGANNLTIPLNSAEAFPIETEIDLGQYGVGQTTIVATGGVTIRSRSGLLKLSGQYAGATIKKIGTDEWWIWGDLA